MLVAETTLFYPVALESAYEYVRVVVRNRGSRLGEPPSQGNNTVSTFYFETTLLGPDCWGANTLLDSLRDLFA